MDNKKPNLFMRIIGPLFGKDKTLERLEEADVQSPFVTVVKTFFENKIAVFALMVYLAMFLFVLIGPMLNPIDLSYNAVSQMNIPPGYDLMKVPKELDGHIDKIAVGSTFSIGLSDAGKLYAWGQTQVSDLVDLKDIPPTDEKVVDIAVGFDHAIALTESGKVIGWGSNRRGQAEAPMSLEMSGAKVVAMEAGYQCSVFLTDQGETLFVGNTMLNDYDEFHEWQYQIVDIAICSDALMGLTEDGQVVYLGTQQNPYSNIPENLGTVIDIDSTANTFAALNDEGKVTVWGNVSVNTNENIVPETDSKKVVLAGGRFHYVAMLEDGHVVNWGSNSLNQTEMSSKIAQSTYDKIFIGSFQNYAVKDGKVDTWGLKGYLMGTDELGRDVFNRLLNGGKMTMTVGAVAVIISTFIGVLVGGLSGYYGGAVDMVFQRISEVVASLPFLPFAMILSALIGNNLTSTQKIIMIMFILGFLSWPGLQRLVRAQVLSVREQEYVTAARALGISEMAIVFKHILPNVISVIIVSATLSFGRSMLTESSLSYLGFGVQAPQPTWGNMLYGANNSIVIQNYWWRWVFPSIALSICVITINLIGLGLNDAIDPKSQGR